MYASNADGTVLNSQCHWEIICSSNGGERYPNPALSVGKHVSLEGALSFQLSSFTYLLPPSSDTARSSFMDCSGKFIYQPRGTTLCLSLSSSEGIVTGIMRKPIDRSSALDRSLSLSHLLEAL